MTNPQGYAQGTRLIHSVTDYQGAERGNVSNFCIVDSSNFGDVEIYEGENGKWGLRLYMDNKGKNLWSQNAYELRGQNVAVLQDGFFVGSFQIKPYDGNGILVIPAMWSESQARLIAQHVRKNYYHTNFR